MIFKGLTYIFIFLLPLNLCGQYNRYMIDDGKLQKSGKVDLKFKLEEYKKNVERIKNSNQITLNSELLMFNYIILMQKIFKESEC